MEKYLAFNNVRWTLEYCLCNVALWILSLKFNVFPGILSVSMQRRGDLYSQPGFNFRAIWEFRDEVLQHPPSY